MIDVTGYDELVKQLERIDETLRRRVTRDCVRAGAEVVAARARQLCPRSANTGSAELQSQETQAERADAKPLAETIGIEVRDYGDRVLALVGPEHPAGALSHLNEFADEDAYLRVLWGRKSALEAKPQPFMRRAFDETREAQQAAMEGVVAQALQDVSH